MTDKEDHQQMSCPPPQTLADLRRAAGMSQVQVAAKMNVGHSRISQIEAQYPNVQHARLMAYIEAIGGRVLFNIARIGDIATDQLVPDASRDKTRARQEVVSKRGRQRQNPINLARTKSAAEELPLQGQTSEPGGDDTGREVDHPDPERDQGDESHSQQP